MSQTRRIKLYSLAAYAALLFVISLSVSCNPRREGEACNSVYYWKTTFSLDSAETAFLGKHDIRRIYLRFFDVDYEYDASADCYQAVPVATVAFGSPKPEGVEIVPTVFITDRAIRTACGDDMTERLATRLINRILKMAAYNDFGPVREIQLDCDWTSGSKESFYGLCRTMRQKLEPDGIGLSATIRLHQLSQDPPPVDRGVLMLYNTGAFRNPSTRNSILDEKDVAPYLKGKRIEYGLPLDYAWPVYEWGVVFRGGQFRSLLHNGDCSGVDLAAGDSVRFESVSFKTIEAVARMVQSAFGRREHGNVLYHLDSHNISNYSDDEIQAIFDF